ncbi:MAG: PHP-associated domain-containing protein [Sulfolobales archaeon]
MISLKADLQIHTICSDGKSTGEDVVRQALIRGLRIIAPTDHNTFRGYELVRRAAESISASMIIVPGNEVKTDLGELIVLCGEAYRDELIPRSAYDLIDFAHANNCVVYAPHPYDPLRLGVRDYVKSLRIDGVEIFNASAPPWSNRKAYRVARELNVALLANSDAHVPEFIGTAYNIVDVEDLTVEEVLESIRKRKIRPVPGRPSIYAYLKDLAHSVRLRLRKI